MLAKAAAAALGGGGGGRDDVAQGGGTDASALPAALAAVKDALARVSGLPARRAPRHRRRQGSCRRRALRSGRAARDARRDRRRATTTPSRAIVALVDEHSAFEILVGLPLNMSGEDTASTADAREFAAALAAASALPVRLVDERLSTVSAHAALREFGQIPAFVS